MDLLPIKSSQRLFYARILRIMEILLVTSLSWRVATLHNQRDFIFFRHHRYIFESKEIKGSDSNVKKVKDAKGEKITQERVIARLQECGPRFTLKLISLQHGTFDTKGGEPGMDTLAGEGFSCDLFQTLLGVSPS
ncbi:hypothetical protein LWI28_018762 [Acer negundo]|uniref:Brix domain-containing protein n=1 Tax=Acer negundo TaxID=4023 RepID=A0AAD5J025_ACENE|nr:hypothetical protein LWI28_018762 [Acer negundo]